MNSRNLMINNVIVLLKSLPFIQYIIFLHFYRLYMNNYLFIFLEKENKNEVSFKHLFYLQNTLFSILFSNIEQACK